MYCEPLSCMCVVCRTTEKRNRWCLVELTVPYQTKKHHFIFNNNIFEIVPPSPKINPPLHVLNWLQMQHPICIPGCKTDHIHILDLYDWKKVFYINARKIMKLVEQQEAFKSSLILTFLFHPYCFQWVLKLIGVNYACLYKVIIKKPS